MEAKPDSLLYPTNWGVRFLCDCKKSSKEISIHKGVAHQISTSGIRILSDHHICEQKKIAMQLMIPSLANGAPQRIVKIIGKSINTIMQQGMFLSEIEFQHFEENGLNELEKNLLQRFDRQLFAQTAQRA
jgi:hypothetical protein